jgi:hypothetical protein
VLVVFGQYQLGHVVCWTSSARTFSRIHCLSAARASTSAVMDSGVDTRVCKSVASSLYLVFVSIGSRDEEIAGARIGRMRPFALELESCMPESLN